MQKELLDDVVDRSSSTRLVGPTEAPDDQQPADGELFQPLTAREKEMLLLEQQWFAFQGVKETRIRGKWDISMTQYYQRLNQLIDEKAARAWDPITVKRLRRLRAARQRSGPVRRFADDD